MQFQDLKLIDPLLRALRDEGYYEPTPVQQQAIPHVLVGRDLIGCAQTGTGKTAAFALPILQRLIAANQNRQRGVIRVLVLSPTRERASQIGESFTSYGRYTGLKNIVIFGGVGQQPQVQALRRGPDILVATRETLAVPVTAVGSSGSETTVMAVRDGLVSRVVITTGIRDGGWVEVLTGLTAGESIVAKAGAFVADGDRINPIPAQAETN